jgi:hypothetical protein
MRYQEWESSVMADSGCNARGTARQMSWHLFVDIIHFCLPHPRTSKTIQLREGLVEA